MAVMESKERVTIVLDKKLLAELDTFARETKVSRSSLLSGLIEAGFRQTKTTRKVFGNRFVAKALHMIFGDGIVKQADKEGDATALANPASEAIRKSIIEQIRQLSVSQAEAEINRDLGLDEEDDLSLLPRQTNRKRT